MGVVREDLIVLELYTIIEVTVCSQYIINMSSEKGSTVQHSQSMELPPYEVAGDPKNSRMVVIRIK